MPQTVDLGGHFVNPLQVIDFEAQIKRINISADDGSEKTVEDIAVVRLYMTNGKEIDVEGVDIGDVAKAIDRGLSTNPIWCDNCGKAVTGENKRGQ